MTTTRQYDYLNRLTGIQNCAGGSPVASFNYGNNTANQRVAVTNADSSYWIYQYDNLGQVTSGKKYWADGTPVAGQQFTYNFDNIGNLLNTGAGGDASGNNLRNAKYTNNVLNQITGRDVPGYVNIIGSANPNATVTVNLQRAYRYGGYFENELSLDNTSGLILQAVTNLAVLNNDTNADIISTNMGNILLPQTPQVFLYDADGDLTNDGVFSYSWDAENRVTNMVSLSTVPTNAAVQEAWSYLPDGRWSQVIVSKWNGTTYVAQSTNQFLWDGHVLLAEVAPNGTLIRGYMRGTDLSGTMYGAGGVGGLLEVSYYGSAVTNCFAAHDGNGNIVALINAANGTSAANYEYDPFGQTIRQTGPMAKENPMRFSTQYADDYVGDIKYLFRNYSPSTERWKNRDTIGEFGGVDLYTFVGNNPISRFDKLGLFWPFTRPCDKCKKGEINHVHVSNWSLIPVSTRGYPNTVSAAMAALSGSELVGLVSDVGGVVTGTTEAELLKKIAEISKSVADSTINDQMTSSWSGKMVGAIGQIQQSYGIQEGVFIDVQVSWQLCEHVTTPNWGGGIPFTGHLDWVDHSYWYINEEAGTSGVVDGFSYDDVKGITMALGSSIALALKNTPYENPPNFD
jgi:RHS repeat-associated protein